MAEEIERKFLVADDSYKAQATSVVPITQGYLNSHPARNVRIRIEDGVGVLTIKGPKDPTGTQGKEWNFEVKSDDAVEIMGLVENTPIEKSRHNVPYEGHLFEVDEFHGRHAGKVIAEVELDQMDEHVELPHWLGREVTGQRQYYNSVMSQPEDPEHQENVTYKDLQTQRDDLLLALKNLLKYEGTQCETGIGMMDSEELDSARKNAHKVVQLIESKKVQEILTNYLQEVKTKNSLSLSIQDSEISQYLSGAKSIDEAVYYSSDTADGKVIMVLPYVTCKRDSEMMDWTGDKLAFDSLESAQEFCRVLNVPLVDSKILDELDPKV